MHYECSARRVPTLRISANIEPLSVGLRGLSTPKVNQDFVFLLWGIAEVRVALYPLGAQKETKTLSVYFLEKKAVEFKILNSKFKILCAVTERDITVFHQDHWY